MPEITFEYLTRDALASAIADGSAFNGEGKKEDTVERCPACGHTDPVAHQKAHLELCGPTCACAAGRAPN